MLFSELDAAVSLVEKISTIFKRFNKHKYQLNESVASRFIYLFESHGVHKNQIPRTFGHGITIFSVQSNKKLLLSLTDDVLHYACSLFNINREWLDGACKKIYPTYDFYKNPCGFKNFLDSIISKSRFEITGVLLVPAENNVLQESLLLIQETIGFIEGAPFYRYYILNNWYYSYWKSRGYLTSCIAYCWLNKIHISGRYLASKILKKICSGENLMPMGKDGIYYFGGKKWHPEDMAINPEKYLEGVDPEQDKFGLKAGLALWLELEAKGFMKSGLDNNDTKHNFSDKLNRMSL